MSLVMGIAINDANYKVSRTKQVNGKTVHMWCCPYYRLWKNMLWRCYGNKRHPSYTHCVVEDSWLIFSNFSNWVKSQLQHEVWLNNPKGFELDKDILGKDAKVYSSNICVFIPKVINNVFLASEASRGDCPLGVSWDKDRMKFAAYISLGNRKKFLGRFETRISAHKAWQQEKVDLCQNILDDYKLAEYTDIRVVRKLEEIISQLRIDLLKNKETYQILRR